jgi:hypothetical protein
MSRDTDERIAGQDFNIRRRKKTFLKGKGMIMTILGSFKTMMTNKKMLKFNKKRMKQSII